MKFDLELGQNPGGLEGPNNPTKFLHLPGREHFTWVPICHGGSRYILCNIIIVVYNVCI